MAKERKKPGRPLGDTIGGILVGFDQQILRDQPPVQELVQKGSPVRGIAGEDGTELLVVFPEDEPAAAGHQGRDAVTEPTPTDDEARA